jgi:hypothetical protein
MASLVDTINAILRRSGIDPNAGQRVTPGAPVDPDFIASQQQPPSSTTELAPAPPPGTAPPPEAPGEPAPAPPAGAKYDPALPYRADTQDDLERMENTRKQFETDLQELFRIRGEAGKARGAATTTSARQRATDEYDAADTAVRQMQSAISTQDTRIAAEKNRRRDEKKAEDAKEPKPKNGDTRTGRDSYTLPNGQTVKGTFTEKYENGVWKYVEGSAKREEGFAGQAQGVADKGTAGTVLTDGQGGYWMVDPYTGTTKALNGPAAATKTANDPDGSVWLLNPDGSKKTKLFDSAPGTYTTSDGRVVGYDKRTGSQVFSIDTQTPEGRALADRLQKATVEAAELANQPKFGGASAQYQAEASRRQELARTELTRLTDLQKSGQISPDQAEAQFDRWMQLNVEGPLAGYKAAAEAERRTQEQENLTRTSAEGARVEALNRQREQLAHAAGEAGREQAIELGRGTRATEYISDVGGLANRLSRGPMGGPGAEAPFQFSAGAFDPANFRKVVPNVNELADAAVSRLLARVSPATARDVNVPLPALPTGPDLAGLMNQVRYQPALAAAPQAEAALPGQEAVDLGPMGQPGRARTVFGNGRFVDWDIPQS